MKNIHYIILSMLLFTAACKKDAYEPRASADVFVINTAVDAGALKVNAGADGSFLYRKAIDLTYGTYSAYGAFTGSNTVTVVRSADTTKALFTRSVDLKPISTLYITGQYPNVETVYQAENNFPFISSNGISPDNSVYIRFANMSPNASSVNIKIQSAATNIATALPYKGVSDFVKYAAAPAIAAIGTTPAVPATPDYVFQVTDAATNVVLGTFTVSPGNVRYKTISIVLRGLVNGTGANTFGILQVSYT